MKTGLRKGISFVLVELSRKVNRINLRNKWIKKYDQQNMKETLKNSAEKLPENRFKIAFPDLATFGGAVPFSLLASCFSLPYLSNLVT